MKTRTFSLLSLTAVLCLAACGKDDNSAPAGNLQHNPLWGTVWQDEFYESPTGRFISTTDRLLFRTDSTGEIFSMKGIVYFSGNTPGESWDTSVAMTYRYDAENNEIFIESDFYANPGHLTYNANKETLTGVGNNIKYVRVM